MKSEVNINYENNSVRDANMTKFIYPSRFDFRFMMFNI